MQFEEILTVHVKIGKTTELRNSDGDSVVMILFTGHATGNYFEGIVLDGGVDTQVIGKGGDRHTLSARYILQGRDHTGQPCEIYVENNGNFNKDLRNALFRTSPKIITNSQALSFLHHALLVGEGLPTESGVDIKIFMAV
ncbi:DUF3237 family protein [Cohnella sp. AR92]|uniref:DUF3237 family protein n=1 Tax=Cohnella sp. AR92 TaxID=648716 RepID=UPI000F8CB0B2|nr:DUF3237 family protein [Cohnella sp. AR92]RUS46067.1 DUF3237 family protein [Cohnella sp. AR92]